MLLHLLLVDVAYIWVNETFSENLDMMSKSKIPTLPKSRSAFRAAQDRRAMSLLQFRVYLKSVWLSRRSRGMIVLHLSFRSRFGRLMGSSDEIMRITLTRLETEAVLIFHLWVDGCELLMTYAKFFFAVLSANGMWLWPCLSWKDFF